MNRLFFLVRKVLLLLFLALITSKTTIAQNSINDYLKAAEAETDSSLQYSSYMDILSHYRFQQQYDEAFALSDILLKSYEEKSYDVFWCSVSILIAEMRNETSDIIMASKILDEVENKLNSSDNIPKEKFHQLYAMALKLRSMLQEDHIIKGNGDQNKLTYLNKALYHSYQGNNPQVTETVQISLGHYYQFSEFSDSAIFYYESVIQNTKTPQYVDVAKHGVSVVYYNTNQYEKAIRSCLVYKDKPEGSYNLANYLGTYIILIRCMNEANDPKLVKLGLLESGFPSIKKLLVHLEQTADSVGRDDTKINTYESILKFCLDGYESNYNTKDLFTKYLTATKALYKNEDLAVRAEYDSKYKINEAELENQVLLNQKTRSTYLAIALGMLAMAIGIFFFSKRKTNRLEKENLELINKQTKEKNEQLEHLDEVKTRFFTNVSHELRTPLTLISSPLEQLLESDTELSTKARSYAKLSLVNAKKLHGRVNEILDLGKIESGKLNLSKNSLYIAPFISRLVHAFESLIVMRNVALNFESTVNENYGVFADTNKLEKVVNNLLSNAVKHAPNDSTITAILSNENNFFSLFVTDEGPGIQEGEKLKIFDRYYQSQSGNMQGGTGIGLALSKELALLMGGDIVVQESVKGASFLFTFTADRATVVEENQAVTIDEITELDSFDISKEFGNTPNILVVEDNTEMREYIKDLLSAKYKVYEAADGQKAYEILQTQKIDLITSDVMMPNRDGFEFLSQVKEDAELKHIPFVMLTARADESDKLQALNENVDDYIVKPFYAKELVARVNNLLLKYKERISHKDEVEDNFQDETDMLIGQIKTYVKEHIADQDLTAETIATEHSTSTTTLNRKLKSAIGLTVTAYIKELRLAFAKDLLMAKQYNTVKEVSAACGFSRPNYFAKEFYKRYGTKPSDYL